MSLEVINLSYHIKNKKIVNQINTEFLPDQIYGIMGPNGSGKSTFLKLLNGILKSTQGEVRWDQHPFLNKSRKEISQIISLVPQIQQPHFDYSVADFIEMGNYFHPFPEQDLDTILHQVDALHLKNALTSKLSGGELQRVYIGRALMTKAPVLLIDEPTAHLDIKQQKNTWKLIETLSKQGKIILVVTHDLHALKQVCTQVLAMKEGLLFAKGPSKEIFEESFLLDLFS